MFVTSEPTSMIIYLVECLVNGKRYVGQTTFDLVTRWRDHKSAAAGRTSNSILHKAIRKYGAENFTIQEVSRASSVEELDALEIQFIRDLGTLAPGGYNQAEGGRNNRKGVKASEETKARLRAAWVRRKTDGDYYHFTPEQTRRAIAIGAAAVQKKWKDPAWREQTQKSLRAAWTPERRKEQALRLQHQREYGRDPRKIQIEGATT